MLPEYDLVTVVPKEPDPVVSRTEVQARARLTRGALGKLEAAGYLSPPYRETSVRELERAPEIRLRPGSRLWVIQTAAAQKEPAGSWRRYTGDAPWLKLDDWLDAVRGDWHNTAAVAAGDYAAIALGTVVTGIIRMEGTDKQSPHTQTGHRRFLATPIVRMIDKTGAGRPLEEGPGENLSLMAATASPEGSMTDLIGARVQPRQGPPAYLLAP